MSAVERHLGRPLGDDRAPLRTIDGRVEPRDGGFRVVLVVRDARWQPLAERELVTAGACRGLDEQLVFVLSLIIDAGLAETSTSVSTSSGSAQVAPVTPTPSSSWSGGIAITGTGAVGFWPGVGFGVGARVDVEPPGWPRLTASATGWVPDRVAVPAGSSRFTALGGGVVACPQIAAWALDVRACGGAEVARLEASGLDFARNRTVVDWIVYGRAEAEIEGGITTRVGWFAAVGLWIPLVRPRFVYADGAEIREIYETPAAAAMVGAGLRVAL